MLLHLVLSFDYQTSLQVFDLGPKKKNWIKIKVKAVRPKMHEEVAHSENTINPE